MRPAVYYEIPPLPPHACFRCRSSAGSENRSYFIDLGCDTYDEGSVVLCNTCMADIALTDPQLTTAAVLREARGTYEAELIEAAKIKLWFVEAVEKMNEIGIDIVKLVGELPDGRIDFETIRDEPAPDPGERVSDEPAREIEPDSNPLLIGEPLFS